MFDGQNEGREITEWKILQHILDDNIWSINSPLNYNKVNITSLNHMQNISDHHLIHAICGSFLDGEKGGTLFFEKTSTKKGAASSDIFLN